MGAEERLRELAITLPDAPAPVASYVPVVITGTMAFVSGQVPLAEGKVLVTGKVDTDVGIDEATEAARRCALQILAVLRGELGSLDRVARIVKVSVFVASSPGFTGQPKVANGASDLLVEVFGEAGRHARAAVGVAELPLGAPVEVEMIAQLEA